MVEGASGMFLFGEGNKLTELSGEDMAEWRRRAIFVFEGNFTMESDKLNVVDTCLGLWAVAIINREQVHACVTVACVTVAIINREQHPL